MADPVLVPQTPVINQGDSPEEIQRVGENIQKIFDKVAPKMKGAATEPAQEKPPQPSTVPSAQPVPEPQKTEEPPKEAPTQAPLSTPEPSRIPSFIEEALRVESSQPAEPKPPVVDELPEEPPTFKTPEESKQNWRQFREKYNAQKKELESLKNRPAVDPQLNEKVTYLENLTKQQQLALTQAGVERHQEFQARILAPMNAAWQEAAGWSRKAAVTPDLAA